MATTHAADLVPDSIADKSAPTIEAALNLPPQDPPTNPKPGDMWVGKEDNPGLFVVMHGGRQLVLK